MKPTALVLAEAKAPGTLAAYESVVWTVLRANAVADGFAQSLLEQLEPEVLLRLLCYLPSYEDPWLCMLSLDEEALEHFAQLSNIDVLAVLLIYLKTDPWAASRARTACVIKAWLFRAVAERKPLREIRNLLTPILEKWDPALRPIKDRFASSIVYAADSRCQDGYVGLQTQLVTSEVIFELESNPNMRIKVNQKPRVDRHAR